MIKKSTCIVVLCYGLLLFILGGYGYLRIGSWISLLSGSGFGFLLILSSIFMFMGKRWASIMATLFTLILMSTFAVRYTMTAKLFPGILAVLSGGMLLFLLAHVARWKQDE